VETTSAYNNPIASTTTFKCIRNPSHIVVFVSSSNHAIAADIVYFLARWEIYLLPISEDNVSSSFRFGAAS